MASEVSYGLLVERLSLVNNLACNFIRNKITSLQGIIYRGLHRNLLHKNGKVCNEYFILIAISAIHYIIT